MTEPAAAWIARRGFEPAYGARPLRRVIQHDVEDPLAIRLLEGGYPEGATIVVDLDDAGEQLTLS